MRGWMRLALILVFCGCSTSPLEWNTDALSDSLSIGNLTRTPVYDTVDPPQVVGLRIEADVINVGGVPINVPFTITWSLKDDGGYVYGTASKRFAGSLAAGGSWHVSLSMTFPPTPNLAGLRDVVTFDLVE